MKAESNGRICKRCKTEISREILDARYSVCPNCGYYMRFHAYKRIKALADKNSFKEWKIKNTFSNPLRDEKYERTVSDLRKKHRLEEAVVTGEMKINGMSTAVGVMDTRFMMASMGHIVGEQITSLFEQAAQKKLPVILFCCSGGARMQEGIVSLMQMEKTAAAVKKHSDQGLLYISVLTNPTMGGVSASFAMIADIVLAEKGAMIGFAGPRVIEQNTGAKLPKDFQTAEFQLSHGFVDKIVSRSEMKEDLGNLLRLHKKRRIQLKGAEKIRRSFSKPENSQSLSPWQKVKIARAKDRPTSMDYIERMFDEFIELHGDRASGDDHAIVGGIANLNGRAVTVIGQQKGKKSLEEATYRNWGMASPNGYRKALRLMKQAEKFNRPIICFVDTIGAACGKEAEEQGQGAIIAELLRDMSGIEVPILSVIISEGGSGGALALGVGNEVWMLENAVYSVLTPEGYASILWKDNARAEEAAELMKLTAADLHELGIVEKVFNEPMNLSTDNMGEICRQLKEAMLLFIKEYHRKSKHVIVQERYQRFRKF